MASAQVGFSQAPVVTPCANLVAPVIPDASILQFTASETHNYSFPAFPIFNSPAATDLSFCNVKLSLRHTGADDTVYVHVWLPLEDWNGRYQAVGGGGLAAGFGEFTLAGPVGQGFVASTTDGGLTLDNTVDPQTALWALNEDGTSNDVLQLNFAWRSIHDMAVASKDLTKQLYGVDPKYSYWLGCSQGGRQGYAAAAKYPEDFDGIVATAPALDSPQLVPSLYWPAVLMRNSEIPPSCVFEEFQKAIIAKCDPLDGATDGLISSHEIFESCDFDLHTLVGKTFSCGEGCTARDPMTIKKRVPCASTRELTITSAHAEIASKILQGPRTANGKYKWYGLGNGADFDIVTGIVLNDDGTRELQPFLPAESWLQYLALQDPTLDMTKMTLDQFEDGFEKSVTRTSALWGNQQLDLSKFKEVGGKLLTWFGLADEFINPSGMMRFREGLEAKFGGADDVDQFQRLFFAPGVNHCAGGVGPNPIDPLKAVMSWVEEGKAPDVLPASTTNAEGVEITRNLCRYPRMLVYKGGDINKASSFTCSGSEGTGDHDEL